MVECGIVVNNPKTSKSYSKKLEANPFISLKVGDSVDGTEIGLEGYKLEITGASDIAGFPIRKDLPGTGRKKIYTTKSLGVKKVKNNGQKVRKTVMANTITDQIAQVNMKIVTPGAKTVEEAWEIKPKEEAKPAA
jgi:small subunit ribosomal protein S6e